MKFNFKKIVAGVLAVGLTMSLCGCGDNGYLMTVDGISIRNGVYLSFQQNALSNANSKYDEENSSSDSSADSASSTESVDIFEQTVEGKSVPEWIKEDTLRQVRRFVAVQQLCKRYEISLTDEEIAEVNKEVQSAWDESNMYVQYLYGADSMGEYYESMGIGIESLKEIGKVNRLSDKLFLHYYDKDGTIPVTDEELNKYITENYASVKMLTLNYKNYKGETLEKDEEKQEIKDKAKAYADRLNGGESFIDVKYDFDLAAARDSAKASAESSYKEDNEDKLTEEEYVKKAVDAATAEKAESLDAVDVFVSKESSSLDEKVTEYIWNAAADGKATVFEGENAAYVIVREDATTKATWIEENRTGLLKSIKGDDYDSMMEITYQNYEVDLDEYLVNSKYAPEKLNKK